MVKYFWTNIYTNTCNKDTVYKLNFRNILCLYKVSWSLSALLLSLFCVLWVGNLHFVIVCSESYLHSLGVSIAYGYKHALSECHPSS